MCTATLVEQRMGVRTIEGDVVHIEEANYFVREQAGKTHGCVLTKKPRYVDPLVLEIALRHR